MTSRILHILIPVVTLLASLGGPAVRAACDDPRIPDRIIVHLAEGVALSTFIGAFERDHPTVGVASEDQVPGRRIHLLTLTLPPEYSDAFLDQLEEDLELDYMDLLVSSAERGAGDFLYTNAGPEGKTGSTWVSGVAFENFEEQYAFGIMGVPPAHQRSTGTGVVVAVLDTGVDDQHPLLAGRVVDGGFNFVDGNDDTRDVGDGVDTDEDGTIDELTGHGTFVAGLVVGVAPDVRVLPVRVLDGDGNGDEWMLTRGIYHAIDRGVEVINLSLGSTYDTVSVKQAILDAALNGIVVVVAAGNCERSDPREFPAMDDVGADDPVIPAIDIEGSIGVAATDDEDVKADFSNYNRRLVLSAPGDTAAGPLDPARAIVGTLPENEYAAWEGTSFATAFVSGAAALVRAQHPEWAADLGTNDAVRLVLETSAADVYVQNPEFAKDRELGAGRLDAAAAVAQGPVTPPLGDLDGNGVVDFADILRLLGEWGLTHSSADFNGDGVVDFADLLVQLGNWA